MKPLVVYSRTGTTRKVGEAIARALNCDSEEITEKRAEQDLSASSGQEWRQQLACSQPLMLPRRIMHRTISSS